MHSRQQFIWFQFQSLPLPSIMKPNKSGVSERHHLAGKKFDVNAHVPRIMVHTFPQQTIAANFFLETHVAARLHCKCQQKCRSAEDANGHQNLRNIQKCPGTNFCHQKTAVVSSRHDSIFKHQTLASMAFQMLGNFRFRVRTSRVKPCKEKHLSLGAGDVSQTY